MALVALGELDRARADYEGILASTAAVLGRDHVANATTHYDLGEALRLAGDCERATASYLRAIDAYEGTLGAGHRFVAYPLTALGECNLELGRPADAIRHAERALALRASWTGDRSLLGRTRFALARALWAAGVELGRARELAAQARDDYAASGRRSEDALARVDAWLRRTTGGAE